MDELGYPTYMYKNCAQERTKREAITAGIENSMNSPNIQMY